MRKLLALLTAFASPALAQTPAGTINAPIYATGYISQGGGTNVTTKIPAQSNHPTNLNIYTTGAISGTWTIKLPNPAFEGQVLSFNCGAAANAISIQSSDGSSIDPNLPTSCGANVGFVTQFDLRSNIWRNLGSGFSASRVTTSQLPLNPIYLSAYALANGSDQSTNLATAFALCSSYGRIIVDGAYTYSTSLTVPSGCTIEFHGQPAKLVYTGNSDALTISSAKNVTIKNLNLDLSGAGTNAVGVHAKGLWFGNFYAPTFTMCSSACNQIGVWFETSVGGGNNFGSHVNLVQGININGTGSYAIGIKSSQTSGDSNLVTALTVSGGWIANAATGINLNYTATFRIEGTALSNGTHAIDVQNSSDGYVSTGEIGAYTGYCYVWRSGNSNINLRTPTSSSYNCSSGVQNNSIYTPQQLTQGFLQLFGSPTDQTYWTSINSPANYTKAFSLTSAGGAGGSGTELMSWGFGQGYLGLNQNGSLDTVFGTSGSVTNQTSGFIYLPSVSGTPTGVPTLRSGYSPILLDKSENKLWYYNGGWISIGTTGSWTPYTPTLACGSGTLTSASATGRYRIDGKTYFVEISAAITTNGTCASYLSATLPNSMTGASYQVLAGRALSSGKMLAGQVQTGGSVVLGVLYDGTYPGANGETLTFSGVLEAQ